MKKQVFTIITFMLFMISSLTAQDRPQRLTAEERTKGTMEKLMDLKLSDETKGKIQVIFNDYYNEQQKAMEEMRASGTLDREAMRTKREELETARNARITALLTPEQAKTWNETVLPSLRPQRRN